MKIEEPYFDKYGKEIKEFAVLKMFHFKGVNEQGRCRKNYYMYKHVKLKKFKSHHTGEETMCWIGYHLTQEKDSYFTLKCVANDKRVIESCEIVQQY